MVSSNWDLAWIKDRRNSANSEGRCANWTVKDDSIKHLQTSPGYNEEDGRLFDYYICGTNSETGCDGKACFEKAENSGWDTELQEHVYEGSFGREGETLIELTVQKDSTYQKHIQEDQSGTYCFGLTEEEWGAASASSGKGIWDNCKPQNYLATGTSPTLEKLASQNKDKCYNMVDQEKTTCKRLDAGVNQGKEVNCVPPYGSQNEQEHGGMYFDHEDNWGSNYDADDEGCKFNPATNPPSGSERQDTNDNEPWENEYGLEGKDCSDDAFQTFDDEDDDKNAKRQWRWNYYNSKTPDGQFPASKYYQNQSEFSRKSEGPAYPVNLGEVLGDVKKEQYWDNIAEHAPEDGDWVTHSLDNDGSLKPWTYPKGESRDCPGGGGNEWRSFRCQGDGMVDDDDWGRKGEENSSKDSRKRRLPGCGQLVFHSADKYADENEFAGYNSWIHGLNFCARPTSHYDVAYVPESEEKDIPGLMECCLSHNKHKNCPINYCRSEIDATDDPLNSCDVPDTTGGAGVCYEMTNECHLIFEETCTREMFQSQEPKHAYIQKNCRKWAKINPGHFSVIAPDICNIDRILNIQEGETLAEKMQTSENREKIINLLNSELCSDYLLTSGTQKSKIEQICGEGNAIERTEDGSWIKTAFGESMGNICECYFPTEYYQWYKTSSPDLSDDQKLGFSAMTSPECFHMGCRMSGFYEISTQGNFLQCPDIKLCKQSIIEQSTYDENSPSGDITRSSGHIQLCDFGSGMEPSPGGDETYEDDTDEDETDGDENTGGSGEFGNGSQFDDDDDAGSFRYDDGTSENGDGDMMMWIVLGMSCCLCIMMLMMFAIAGKSKSGTDKMMKKMMMMQMIRK